MAAFLSVTNWRRYQHYSGRTPIWIKSYIEMLHDPKLKNLPVSTRLLWHQMLFLAATFQNSVPNSPELISELVGIPPEECREGIALLVKGRWLREKQTRRAASKNSLAQSKKENEEKEKIGRHKAVIQAAENFVRASAYYVDDKGLVQKLGDEYGISDQVTIRRLLVVAAEEREAA